MSGAEKLTTRILSEAEREAAALLNEAKERAAALRQQAQTEAAGLLAKAKAQAEEQGQGKVQRLQADLALEHRKELLAAKQALIDEAFERVIERLANLPKAEYQKLICEQIVKVSNGTEALIIGPQDEERLDADFLTQVNQALVAAGKPGNLTLAPERRPIRAGFILKAPGVEINNSFEAILRQQRYYLEAEVANLLFGEQK